MQRKRTKGEEETTASQDRAKLYPIAIASKRLQSVVHMKLETEFLRFGITLAQWDVLCSIRQNPGASGAEIARDCLVTPQTVSLVLPRLEQMSLITRQKAERGRVIQTWITKTGENALEQCNLHIAAVERLLTSAIGVEQAEKLADSLKLCVIALAGRPDPKVAAM